MLLAALAALSVVIWLYLAVWNGRSWRTSVRLPKGSDPHVWPTVVAVVPARDEADVLPTTLPTLLEQQYPGAFRIIVVDDDSSDGTGGLARELGAEVVPCVAVPPGWTGKVNALATGLEHVGAADFVLFTDADIAYAPGAVAALVRAASHNNLVLTSQMVRLRAISFWERQIVPAFVYFFAQLYPFARVNAAGRTAAAAGGCMLVRRDALERAGGLEPIRDALIDDVALGKLLKQQGRIWLGLTTQIESVRSYPRLADLWHMIVRSADTQLRHSRLLLIGTVIGLLLTYVVPPVAAIVGVSTQHWLLAALGAGAWLLMAATYVPMLRFHRVSPGWALNLPSIAVLYLAMTVDSARRHRQGRGGAWKGRTNHVNRG